MSGLWTSGVVTRRHSPTSYRLLYDRCMKFVVTVLTVVAVLFAAAMGFGVVLVMLNGFSERDGGVALSVYGVFALVTTVASAVAVPVLAWRFEQGDRTHPAWRAGLLTTAGGCGLLIAGSIGAIVLASILHSR